MAVILTGEMTRVINSLANSEKEKNQSSKESMRPYVLFLASKQTQVERKFLILQQTMLAKFITEHYKLLSGAGDTENSVDQETVKSFACLKCNASCGTDASIVVILNSGILTTLMPKLGCLKILANTGKI